jgi:RNA polymerase sigma-70 factor (ECF subfamily)
MGKTVPTDEQLVERIQAGDDSGLEELLTRYEDKVYNLAFRMVGIREDAEDVLQETFINVIRALGRFQGRSSFSTWIYRVAANTALTKLRKQSRKVKTEDEFLENVYAVRKAAQSGAQLTDWSGNPARELLNDEAMQMMNQAIEGMPEIYRAVFVLRDIEELSTAETADVLELTEAAVKSRLHRARVYLRNELSSYFGHGESA